MSDTTTKTARDYFHLAMAVMYFIFGFVFIFTNVAIEHFPVYRTAFGCILIAYSIFRVYSFRKKK